MKNLLSGFKPVFPEIIGEASLLSALGEKVFPSPPSEHQSVKSAFGGVSVPPLRE